MPSAIVTDKRGTTLGTFDAPDARTALDLLARSKGYEDADDQWISEGSFRGRVFLHDGLQYREVPHE